MLSTRQVFFIYQATSNLYPFPCTFTSLISGSPSSFLRSLDINISRRRVTITPSSSHTSLSKRLLSMTILGESANMFSNCDSFPVNSIVFPYNSNRCFSTLKWYPSGQKSYRKQGPTCQFNDPCLDYWIFDKLKQAEAHG